MESKQKILNWKKKEEKHLVLINPKMLRSQIGMINETVKCIRNYHYHCIWCTESLCGILCHIQALCSRNQFLLAEVQQMNTRVMDSLGIFPINNNVPLLGTYVSAGEGLAWVRCCSPDWSVEGEAKKICGYSHEDASLAPALLSSSLPGFDSQ